MHVIIAEKTRFMPIRTGRALRKGPNGRGEDVYLLITAGNIRATGV